MCFSIDRLVCYAPREFLDEEFEAKGVVWVH